jgi:hypothetical protein
MRISKTAKNLFKGRVGAYRISDIFLAAIGNPKLLGLAIKHVSNRRARALEGGLIAMQSVDAVIPEQTPVSSAADLIEELGQKFGVILIKRGAHETSIGIADLYFLSALLLMKNRTEGARFTVDDRAVQYHDPEFRRLVLTAHCIKFHFMRPDLKSETISVEPYVRHETGVWLSNNIQNKHLRALHDDHLKKPSLTHAEDILNGKDLTLSSLDRKIDAVYTWVDHSDPAWAKLYDEAMGGKAAQYDANNISRFHNNEELKYSLRSLHTYAPWFNKIYIVTNCRKPHWAEEANDKIVWVDHAEILPESALPTFNSHTIESALHKIPDLSEHFVYFNDDMFLAKPIEKEFFFDPNGTSKSFLESYGMVSGTPKVGDADYLNASRNASRLLKDATGCVATQLHRHTGYALRKSVLFEIEQRWSDALNDLRHNKFRTVNDLNLTSFLYHHYALAKGYARTADINAVMVKTMDIRWRALLETTAPPACDTFCINEGGILPPAADWHETIAEFLRSRFPEPAPWEHS